MAVFRDGVKMGKFDVRMGLSKKRVNDLMKKHKLIENRVNNPADVNEIKSENESKKIRAKITEQPYM